MSRSKRVAASSLDRPRELFSWRTLLIIMLVTCCVAPLLLWVFGVGLENGKAAGAVVAVILFTASVGEFIRGRFRLSLRLWLIAFTALSVFLGLYAQQLVTVAKQRRAVQRVRTLGGRVSYDFQSEGGDWFITRGGVMLPGWIRGVFSSDVFGHVRHVNLPVACGDDDLRVILDGVPDIEGLRLALCKDISDAGLEDIAKLGSLRLVVLNGQQATASAFDRLSQLPNLERIELWGQQVTDDTLNPLSKLRHLKQLGFYNCAVTDAGMESLSHLDQLEHLNLGGAPVTDAGMTHLRRLINLRVLILGGTTVSDASIVHFEELPNLRHLNLAGTKVTDVVIEQLDSLPALRKIGLPPLSQTRLESFKNRHPDIEVSYYNGRWMAVHQTAHGED